MKNRYKLLTGCAIAGFTAGSIALMNKLIFVTATVKEILPKSRILTFDWRFGKVCYTKRGQGKPLLLIHDMIPGSSDCEWKDVVTSLASHHTVYTMDLLGFGRSDKPAITYTNYLYVQLISDFIKTVIGKRTDVIASGSSSSLVIMSCCNDSSLFDKIMLVNPDTLLKTNQIPSKRTKLLKLFIECPIVGTLVYNIMVSNYFIRQDFYNSYFASPYTLTNGLQKSYHEAAHLGGSNAKYIFSSLKGNYTNFSISHKINEIDNSIYIVGGARESYIEQTINDYQELNPIIESSLIEHAKHFPQIEKPEEFFQLCSIFFH